MNTPLFDSLSEDKQNLIRKHLDLVIEANKTTNLTRIDTFEEGMVLHVEDSLQALQEIAQAPEGRYGDLGTGGGFPGITIAITSGRETLLVDARQKKMVILSDIIKELGIEDQVSVFAGRAELLARKEPESFAVLTARALAKLSVLMELASPLLAKGGLLVCYKARVEDEELSNAKRVEKLTGMKLVSRRGLTLNETVQREIVVFEKISKPKMKLPRQEGQAQKKPL